MSLAQVLVLIAPVWVLVFLFLGGVRRKGPWDGKVFDLIGYFGAATALGAAAVLTWATMARARWAVGADVPVPVHVIGGVGAVLLGAAAFALVIASLLFGARVLEGVRERSVARFAEGLARAVEGDPAVVRVWVLHPFEVRSNPPLPCLLAVEANGQVSIDLTPFLRKAQTALDLPGLPRVIVGPPGTTDAMWPMIRRLGRCVFDRESHPSPGASADRHVA